MKCITCGTEMKSIDDITGFRIDWVECPNCKSKAEITYGGNNREYEEKVIWKKCKDKDFDNE